MTVDYCSTNVVSKNNNKRVIIMNIITYINRIIREHKDKELFKACHDEFNTDLMQMYLQAEYNSFTAFLERVKNKNK